MRQLRRERRDMARKAVLGHYRQGPHAHLVLLREPVAIKDQIDTVYDQLHNLIRRLNQPIRRSVRVSYTVGTTTYRIKIRLGGWRGRPR